MPPTKSNTAPRHAVNVPVGVGTIAGLGSGGSAFILALVAFISGDRSQETIAGLASGSFLIAVTVIGRMLQAARLASPDVINVVEAGAQDHFDPGPAAKLPRPSLFDREVEEGPTTGIVGPRHSEPVAEHDRDIEGGQYDALVTPEDEERDIHEVT